MLGWSAGGSASSYKKTILFNIIHIIHHEKLINRETKDTMVSKAFFGPP